MTDYLEQQKQSRSDKIKLIIGVAIFSFCLGSLGGFTVREQTPIDTSKCFAEMGAWGIKVDKDKVVFTDLNEDIDDSDYENQFTLHVPKDDSVEEQTMYFFTGEITCNE